MDDESYSMEFISKNYVIRIEKYYRELYPSVYPLSDMDSEINLFNLLSFLKQNDKDVPKSNFFRKEKVIDECYRQQLSHISNVIFDNLDLLNDFFSIDKFEGNVLEFNSYWKNKHPELYRTI